MYESPQEWFDALKTIAKSHNNEDAIKDFFGWTCNWETETPYTAYYNDFPEHLCPNADS